MNFVSDTSGTVLHFPAPRPPVKRKARGEKSGYRGFWQIHAAG
jgi:hypothetical protein